MAIRAAAVRNELCPETRQNNAAGESTTGTRIRQSDTCRRAATTKTRNPDQRPACQRGEIAQLPERCRQQHDTGWIRPVLAIEFHAEQGADRIVIGRQIVELPGRWGRGGAAIHPEIQKVATDREPGSVTRDGAGPIDAQHIDHGGGGKQHAAEQREVANTASGHRAQAPAATIARAIPRKRGFGGGAVTMDCSVMAPGNARKFFKDR